MSPCLVVPSQTLRVCAKPIFHTFRTQREPRWFDRKSLPQLSSRQFREKLMAALWQRAGMAGVAALLGLAALRQPLFCQAGAQKAAENVAQSIERGDLKGARNILDLALKQYPRSAALHKVAAVLEFKSGHLDSMRAELLRAAECDPNDAETHLNLALLEFGQGPVLAGNPSAKGIYSAEAAGYPGVPALRPSLPEPQP